MSTSIIYYGAPVKGTQVVSEELKARGINLLRSSPYVIGTVGIRLANAPSYDNYLENIASSLQSAETDTMVPVIGSDRPFYPFTHKSTPVFTRDPAILWSYEKTPTSAPDQLDTIRDRFNASETTAHGKPAFMATLTSVQVRELVSSTSPSETTPASTTAINIQAYKVYLLLHRVFDAFMRMHQYPLVQHGQDSLSELFRQAINLEASTVEKIKDAQVRVIMLDIIFP